MFKITKIAISPQRFDQSSRNLVRWCKMGLLIYQTLQNWISKIQDGGQVPSWKPRGNWQDFNWHNASCGPSAIAELLVLIKVCTWWPYFSFFSATLVIKPVHITNLLFVLRYCYHMPLLMFHLQKDALCLQQISWVTDVGCWCVAWWEAVWSQHGSPQSTSSGTTQLNHIICCQAWTGTSGYQLVRRCIDVATVMFECACNYIFHVL